MKKPLFFLYFQNSFYTYKIEMDDISHIEDGVLHLTGGGEALIMDIAHWHLELGGVVYKFSPEQVNVLTTLNNQILKNTELEKQKDYGVESWNKIEKPFQTKQNEVVGTTEKIVDLLNNELTQDEWNALCIVHRMTGRLNIRIQYNCSNSIDVISEDCSQIVDANVFLYRENSRKILTSNSNSSVNKYKASR